MADPGALAASLIQTHFPKFGTNRKECDYRQMGETTYNTATQTGTPVISQTHPGLFIIFANFNFTQTQAGEMQKDGEPILSIDKKAIFPALDLPFPPQANDRIVDDENIVWRVMGISGDPKPAIHTLHVRPLNIEP